MLLCVGKLPGHKTIILERREKDIRQRS